MARFDRFRIRSFLSHTRHRENSFPLNKINSILLLLLLVSAIGGYCQPVLSRVANAHSHNDYKQDIPFYKAWRAGFGSIEADIYLKNGSLLVAHEPEELDSLKSLRKLYLDPLREQLFANNGYPFSDSTKKLQLLIDIKTDSILTLKRLVELLQTYPELTACKNLHFVITGNRPSQHLFISYPGFIFFDGVLSQPYSKEALSRILLFSDNFANYSGWNGKGKIDPASGLKIKNAISRAHALRKPVRFWNAPDNENAWLTLIRLKADYINTDHISELASFLNNK
jgi:alkaline phosphatase